VTLFLVAGITGLAACHGAVAQRPTADDPPQVARIEHGLLPAGVVRGEDVRFDLVERMRKYGIPGLSLAVIEHGHIAWAKAYGVADASTGAPVTPTTLFQAASISKPVNAAAALIAVTRGQLALDAPINASLKQWQIADNDFTRATPVTLRQLLSHTAGTTVHGFLGYEAGAPLPTVPQLLDGAPPANSPAVVVAMPPGAQERYSGGGVEITQLALTDQLARPYAAILDELVLGPVGMTHSTFAQPLPAAQVAEAAAGHIRGRVIPGKRHVYPEQAAAGLWTTPTDLGKFLIEVYRGRAGESKAIPEIVARQMTTPVAPAFPHNGLGLRIATWNGAHVFGHDGGNEGFECHATMSFDGNGVVIMTNAEGADRIFPEIERAVDAVYGWPGAPPTIERVAVGADELARITGAWSADLGDPLTIVRDGDRVVLARPFDEPMELVPVAGGDFVGRADGAHYRVDGDGLVRTADTRTQRWTRLDPATALPLVELARGDDARAAAAYRALRARDAKSPAVDEGALNQAGYEILRYGRAADAVRVFRLIVAMNPDSANALDSLGEACAAAGDVAQAIASYQAALAALAGDPRLTPESRKDLEAGATRALARLRSPAP
jgi:CubicO group peptidase (beta-lactamase class C family)